MSSRRYRLGFVAAAVAVAAIAIGACGGDDDDSSGGAETTTATEGGETTTEAQGGEGLELAFNLASREIPYFQDLAAGMEAEAAAQGATLTSTFGTYEIPKQFSQLENLGSGQPDGMIIGPIDQEALIPAYRQLADQGIPIVTVSDNIGPDGEEFQVSYVGHPYEELGANKAQFIVDELGGEGKVGIIHGLRGGNFTEAQNIGAMAVFEENPGIEVVDGPYVGDYLPDLGLKGTENLLSRDSDLDAIYYDNDDLALGGIEAIDARGIAPEDITVVGTDGGPPALAAVGEGTIDYTISLCGYAQGVEAVRVLIDAINAGDDPGPIVVTPQLVLTTENLGTETTGLTVDDCNAAAEEVGAA